MRKQLVVLAAAALALTPRLNAQFTEYTTLDVGGVVANSASAAYLAAVGGASEYFLPFGVDQFGSPVSGPVSGDVFSPLVTFSTLTSGLYGGVAGPLVNSSLVEVGPYDEYDGILNIDFAVNGFGASAVGVGTVLLSGTVEFFRLYDVFGGLVASGDFDGFSSFGFRGWVATGSDRIGRLELEGDFFSIQDIQFDGERIGDPGSTVPEPASMTLLATGLAGLAAARRRRAPKD